MAAGTALETARRLIFGFYLILWRLRKSTSQKNFKCQAATSTSCTSARDERAGSGCSTSWPTRSRHFRALPNNAVQHRALRGPAVQGAHHASSTPASPSQFASSARHRLGASYFAHTTVGARVQHLQRVRPARPTNHKYHRHAAAATCRSMRADASASPTR